MKNFKSIFFFKGVATVLTFSSCTSFEDNQAELEDIEIQVAEKTMRRGGVRDEKSLNYQGGNDLLLRKRPERK
jgi:hypothetical protein